MKSFLQITKLPLSLLVALSGLFGSLLIEDSALPTLFMTFLGILFLSIGAASLNNIQDRHLDRQFTRTSNRPLASSQINWPPVLTFSTINIVFGTLLLFIGSERLVVPIIGWIALFLYNGLYTPLKPKTVWALMPGALSGMLPPYIGWLAAGGALYSTRILLVMMLLGIWQIPHYWLLLLEHRQELLRHRTIYSIITGYSEQQLRRIIFTWVIAFTCLSYCLPLVGVANHNQLSWILVVVNGVILAGSFLRILASDSNHLFKELFHHLNLSLLLVMVIASADIFYLISG